MAFSKFFKISVYNFVDVDIHITFEKTFKNQISDGIYHFLYVYLQYVYKNISSGYSGSNSIGAFHTVTYIKERKQID